MAYRKINNVILCMHKVRVATKAHFDQILYMDGDIRKENINQTTPFTVFPCRTEMYGEHVSAWMLITELHYHQLLNTCSLYLVLSTQ